jgi:hypothetical protein
MEKVEDESALTKTRDHIDGEYEIYNNWDLDFNIIQWWQEYSRINKFWY